MSLVDEPKRTGDHGNWYGAFNAARRENEKMRALLAECAPHVFSAAESEHLLDGFRPQRRPLDDLADRVREFMGSND